MVEHAFQLASASGQGDLVSRLPVSSELRPLFVELVSTLKPHYQRLLHIVQGPRSTPAGSFSTSSRCRCRLLPSSRRGHSIVSLPRTRNPPAAPEAASLDGVPGGRRHQPKTIPAPAYGRGTRCWPLSSRPTSFSFFLDFAKIKAKQRFRRVMNSRTLPRR